MKELRTTSRAVRGDWGKALLAIVALVLLLSAQACGNKNVTPHRQGLVVLNQFADSLKAVQDGFIQAKEAGALSDADNRAIQRVIEDVALAGQQANAAIGAGEMNAAIDRALVGLESLLNDGVLRIKNAQSQQIARLAINAARSILATARAISGATGGNQ